MNTGPDLSGPFGHVDLDLNFIAGSGMYNLEVVQIKCEMLVDNGSIQFEFKDNQLIWVVFLDDKNKKFPNLDLFSSVELSFEFCKVPERR